MGLKTLKYYTELAESGPSYNRIAGVMAFLIATFNSTAPILLSRELHDSVRYLVLRWKFQQESLIFLGMIKSRVEKDKLPPHIYQHFVSEFLLVFQRTCFWVDEHHPDA